MDQAVVKQQNDIVLRKNIEDVGTSVVETLRSFVNRPISASPDGDVQCVDLAEWRASWPNSRSVVRGTLEGMDEEHSLVLIFDTADTITLCGHLMFMAQDVIQSEREAMVLGNEFLEALGELGNLLCATMNSVVRQQTGSRTGVRIRDFETIPPGSQTDTILGLGPRLVYGFNLKIGDLPVSQMYLVIDHEVGEEWNDRIPLFMVRGGDTDGGEAHTQTQNEPRRHTSRSKLAAFVTSIETASRIRECGRKIGLEVQRYARTDVPNPAAHTDDIVLIEIPVGDEKRFDWAKRLRQYHKNIPVVLLIHEPSRPRVVQGLLTRSNVILAWPSKEAQLREKIEALLEIEPDDEES